MTLSQVRVWLYVIFGIFFCVQANASTEDSVAQFHFQQAQYRQALTWLSDRPDSKLKARTLLKLGLFDEARLMFEALPLSTRVGDKSPQNGALFWFIQASRAFYVGDQTLAREALANIRQPLPEQYQQQANYLNARLALLAGDKELFEQYRRDIAPNSPLAVYLSHHAILAKIDDKQLNNRDLSRHLAMSVPTSEALNALYHRTLLAMAQAFILENKNDLAIAALTPIKRSPSLNSEVKVSLGWALNNTKQYQRAREVFAALFSNRSHHLLDGNAVRGYAYALAQLDSADKAVAVLQQSITAYQQELMVMSSLPSRYQQGHHCLANALSGNDQASCYSQASGLEQFLSEQSVALVRQQRSLLDGIAQDHLASLAQLAMHKERLLARQSKANQTIATFPLPTINTTLSQLKSDRNKLSSDIEQAALSRNSYFFLPQRYRKQQHEIDKLHTEVILLKRAGLGNAESELRVEFMQRTIWWHGKSKLSANIAQTKQQLAQLDHSIMQLSELYAAFSDYEQEVNEIDDELARIAKLEHEVIEQQQELLLVENQLEQQLSESLRQYLNQRHASMSRAMVDIKLALVKIQDVVYQRVGNEAGEEQLPALETLIAGYQELLNLNDSPALIERLHYRHAELLLRRSEIAQELGSAIPSNHRGYYDSNITNYQQLITGYPQSQVAPHLYYQLAKAYDLQGESGQSHQTITKLLAQFPNSVYTSELNFRRGEYLFAKQEYREAAQAYNKVVNATSRSAYLQSSLYMLAWSHLNLGSNEHAIGYFSRLLDASLPVKPTLDLAIDKLPKGDRQLVADALNSMAQLLGIGQGAQKLTEHYDSIGGRYYEYLVYQTLAQHYLIDQRYQDSGATYATFVERFENHQLAPGFALDAIAVYQQGDMASLVMQQKQAFIDRYGINGKLWRQWPDTRRNEVSAPLKRFLIEIAQNHYRQAKLSEQLALKQALYAKAATVFSQYIDTFNDDEHIAFIYAESLYASGQYAEAITAYQQYAYAPLPFERGEDKRSDAAYMAIMSYQKLLANRLEETAKVYARAHESSVVQFIQTFVNDKRNLTLLTQLMNQQFKQQRYMDTIDSAQQIIARGNAVPTATMHNATLLLAHARFNLKQFPQAAQDYLAALNHLGDGGEQREQILEHYATSLYQQAQVHVEQQQLPQAVQWLSELISKAPLSSLRRQAQFNNAQYLYQLNELDQALGYLNDFRTRFKGDKLNQDIPAQIASIYEQQQDWANAATEYLAIANATNDKEQRQQPLYLAALYFERAKQYNSALLSYRKHANTYTRPFDRAVEVRHKLTELYLANNKPLKRAHWLRKLMLIHDRAGSLATQRSRSLAASSALHFAKQAQYEFNRVKLTLPLNKSLQRKKARLTAVVKAYKKATSYQVAQVTTQSTYQMAKIYQQLAIDLMGSQRPKGLDALALEQYDILLEEQAYPFEEQAIAIYESNAQRTASGHFDQWIKQSFAALAKILPGRYNKTEMQEKDQDVIY